MHSTARETWGSDKGAEFSRGLVDLSGVVAADHYDLSSRKALARMRRPSRVGRWDVNTEDDHGCDWDSRANWMTEPEPFLLIARAPVVAPVLVR